MNIYNQEKKRFPVTMGHASSFLPASIYAGEKGYRRDGSIYGLV
jgi:hypothetical protein